MSLTLFKAYDGRLNFATDAWTSPNHRAYVAISVHLERNGVAFSMILDIVEVAQSHSGANLAGAFVRVLQDFGITDKVSIKQRGLKDGLIHFVNLERNVR
jgi:hypothetical protein